MLPIAMSGFTAVAKWLAILQTPIMSLTCPPDRPKVRVEVQRAHLS
jgi:hypothetical protein